uniref:AlNc14C64G4574 protein n=1 Tax=Albugo laibachii Nc14 TaxID=890382 RepID=F0WD54_9STRA|nr:AlNc14C64G4574 [Albugo laibachii Nc14]|eukprot:CCA19126.1 AlNc14C64G4574 [Albugo laibachii Nc14]
MNVSTVRPLEKGTFGTAFLILPLYRFPYTEQQFVLKVRHTIERPNLAISNYIMS